MDYSAANGLAYLITQFISLCKAYPAQIGMIAFASIALAIAIHRRNKKYGFIKKDTYVKQS